MIWFDGHVYLLLCVAITKPEPTMSHSLDEWNLSWFWILSGLAFSTHIRHFWSCIFLHHSSCIFRSRILAPPPFAPPSSSPSTEDLDECNLSWLYAIIHHFWYRQLKHTEINRQTNFKSLHFHFISFNIHNHVKHICCFELLSGCLPQIVWAGDKRL